MTAIRLYMDEDSMARALVRALRARGMDVTTALECGLIEREDDEHLAYSTSQGRVLFSYNIRDFSRLHGEWLAQGREHAGLILAPQQRHTIGEELRSLLALSSALTAEQMRNRLEYLAAPGFPET